MLWAEWWGGEINIFMAGLLCTVGVYAPHVDGNVTPGVTAASRVGAGASGDQSSCVPVDVFPLLAQIMIVCFMTHLGFSVQGGAHLGNLLGANKPQRAAATFQVR